MVISYPNNTNEHRINNRDFSVPQIQLFVIAKRWTVWYFTVSYFQTCTSNSNLEAFELNRYINNMFKRAEKNSRFHFDVYSTKHK